MSAEGGPIIHSPSTLVVPTGRPRSSGNREEGAGGPSDIPLFLDHFRIVETWWPRLWLVAIICRYDCAPKFDIHWHITDWTALTDKANGNALRDANGYCIEFY